MQLEVNTGVIPAKAGIQLSVCTKIRFFAQRFPWIPAFAGMTPGWKIALLTMVSMFFMLPAHASAARFTGNYLLEMCAVDKDGKELVQGGHALCQAYIAGLLDYHNLIRSMGAAPSVDFCVPDAAPLNKLQNDVAAYLYNNKNEHGSFVASPGVALALYGAYPCKKRK